MSRSFIILLTFLSFIGCNNQQKTQNAEGSPKDRLQAKIDSIETQIRISIDSARNPDVGLALEAIRQYELFSYKYADDSLSPVYTFKSAQIFDGMLNDKAKAAELYLRIYDNYPEYKNRPMMLFYRGNALHDLGDTTNAVNSLKLFIAKYPEHEFRDDAENLVEFIRMDEEDMMKFFKSGSGS